jgi:predicted kinase
MSLLVFVTRECGSAALLTRAAAIVAKGKSVCMEGGMRRFSRACALAQACRCEVRT